METKCSMLHFSKHLIVDDYVSMPFYAPIFSTLEFFAQVHVPAPLALQALLGNSFNITRIVELIHLGSWLAGSLKPTNRVICRRQKKLLQALKHAGSGKLASFIACRVNPQFRMANLCEFMMPACAQGMSEGTCDLTNARLRHQVHAKTVSSETFHA